jgi:AraC family transcriptional regulator
MTRSDARAVSAPIDCFRVPGFHVRMGTHPAATSLPRHEHELPTICCVQHGRFTEHYPGKSVTCDPRMVKITPAGEPHWNEFDAEDTLGLRIDVEGDRFREMPAVARILEERSFFQANVFDGLARRLITEIVAPDECASIAAEALLLELLAQLARMPRTDARPGTGWLQRADEMVHDLYRSTISVSAIAAAVGVHPATLARAYRRAYGCSVGERIRSLRLGFAARGLADSRRTVSSVALDAGFYDQSHFTRTFQRQYRMSPLQYRRRVTA